MVNFEDMVKERNDKVKEIAKTFDITMETMIPTIKSSTSKEWEGRNYRLVAFVIQASRHSKKSYVVTKYLNEDDPYPTDTLATCFQFNGSEYIAAMNDLQAYIRPLKANEKVESITTMDDINQYKQFVASKPVLELWE
jgi:hypothetical protein